MKGIYESLDGRVSVLEKLKEAEATKQVDAAEWSRNPCSRDLM